jgi:glucokinase
LEAVASGTAIARDAKELAACGRGAKILLAAGGDPAGITAATVAAAAAAGDTAAEGIIARAARYLGIGIAGIINLLNPSLVILGGGVMNIGELIWQNLGPEVQARSLEAAGKNARLKGAELGGRAGVMGAIALALMDNRRYKDSP